MAGSEGWPSRLPGITAGPQATAHRGLLGEHRAAYRKRLWLESRGEKQRGHTQTTAPASAWIHKWGVE